MSSKTQLNDYVKTLKREISELKRENEIINKQNLMIKSDRIILKSKLFKSRLRERKWYHFF